MPKYQAPNHVHSVSVAGVEYQVENGNIDAPYDVQAQLTPLGFTLLNEHDLKAAAIAEAEAQRLAEAEKLAQDEEKRKAEETAKAELAEQKKADAEAKKQAAAEEKARIKAEAEAKATENTPATVQE